MQLLWQAYREAYVYMERERERESEKEKERKTEREREREREREIGEKQSLILVQSTFKTRPVGRSTGQTDRKKEIQKGIEENKTQRRWCKYYLPSILSVKQNTKTVPKTLQNRHP